MDKVYFLGYIMLVQRVRLEDKQIKVVKNWPKLILVRDIEIFISFTNFYQCFLQSFSNIAVLFIS